MFAMVKTAPISPSVEKPKRLPQSAIGSEMAHPSSSLVERIPQMYAIPPKDLLYEQ